MGWWVIVTEALLFTLFGAILRQSWNPVDLSLFLVMGIGFGWLRLLTGSVWMSIGFHAAFQTGAQLVLTHEGLAFDGGTGTAMLALGMVPFTVAAAVTSALGIPRAVHAGSRAPHEQTGSTGLSAPVARARGVPSAPPRRALRAGSRPCTRRPRAARRRWWPRPAARTGRPPCSRSPRGGSGASAATAGGAAA